MASDTGITVTDHVVQNYVIGDSPSYENQVSFSAPGSVGSSFSSRSPTAYIQNQNNSYVSDIKITSNESVFFENQKHISFVHWNVDGILSKLKDIDFISYISKFDVICLAETFVQKFDNTLFPDHTLFIKSSLDLGNKGRDSGGVICLIRSSVLKYFRQINYDGCGNFLAFKVNKELFGYHSDILFLYAYVPPECSKYYNVCKIDNGIHQLEDFIIDCFSDLGEMPIIVCGDFNSRTADKFPSVFDIDKLYDHMAEDNDNIKRCSEDMIMNTFGKNLLDMCTALNLYIMNGVCNGDLQGRFTYISEFGSSVNDYFLLSCDLYDLLITKCSIFVSEMIQSKHMPIEFRIAVDNNFVCDLSNIDTENEIIEKYTWKNDYSEQFQEHLSSTIFKDQLRNATIKLTENINTSIDLFNKALKCCANSMIKKIKIFNNSNEDQWFDYECILFRRQVRKSLRKYRKTSEDVDRQNYCKLRREYKNLIHFKKKEFKNSIFNKLVTALTSQNDFWQKMKLILRKKSKQKNNISLDGWYKHFKGVLEKDDIDDVDMNDDDHVTNEYIEDLDKPISKDEILKAMQKLKNNKASGPDGLIGEFYKFSSVEIIEYLVLLFNKLFDNGYYPNEWSESIILPLFKKGNINDPNNYRGISLCNIASKLYSSVINNRLKCWIDKNNLTGEYQAGFKSGYATVDHIFTLLACVQKQFSNKSNRKLYVAFIDFQKAFDTVSRKLLWPILAKNKIHGKLLKCVKSMYRDVRAKVRAGAKLTDFINCTEGVKQGDVCSPLLFSLFINELALEIIQKGRHGIKLAPDILELFVLLFADDIILLSETVVGLQTQLNNLYTAASKLRLTVNLAKSNVLVFRLGGFLGERERWFYAGKRMEVVNCYKYLGIYFSTKLSFSFACQDLVARAKRATSCILNTLYQFDRSSVSLFLKLFDCQVQPIMLYGAEVWGLMAGNHIESAHLFALKRFLGVDRRTPNDFIYGEFSRYPIYLNAYVKCIKYWLKLIQMSHDRLPYKAYKMLYTLDTKGKKTWASDIRDCLCRYGFACVWMNQGVGNIDVFLKCFKDRIIDCYWQTWHDHINSSERYSLYCQFKTSHYMEPYLNLNMNRYVMKALVYFRIGISELLVHKNRYKNTHNGFQCRLCHMHEENELHILLCCTELDDLRSELIPAKFHNRPNLFKLILIMSNKNENLVHNLSLYLYKCLKMLEHASS